MHHTRYLVAALVAAAAAAPPAYAQETPPGYKFCGWKDMDGPGWEYGEPDSGAYVALYSRNLSCRRARRNYNRVRYPPPDYKPTLRRYRCRVLDEAHEYLEARCVRRNRPKVRFRWQTGA